MISLGGKNKHSYIENSAYPLQIKKVGDHDQHSSKINLSEFIKNVKCTVPIKKPIPDSESLLELSVWFWARSKFKINWIFRFSSKLQRVGYRLRALVAP